MMQFLGDEVVVPVGERLGLILSVCKFVICICYVTVTAMNVVVCVSADVNKVRVCAPPSMAEPPDLKRLWAPGRGV